MPQKQAEIINDIKFTDALAERFIAYSMSTIVARSLPDVRDGLKPVHRRILYAMRELKLDPKTGFKKCARVVGDVMGKFHPHGDAAIYDAMVRLAQDFSSRYTMVEGQGNFGNIDGDSAAAMRYTEARLTPYAMTVMEGLDDDAVPFVDTYDGGEQEPAVMPSAVPNLLANGCTGIAVGMATNIPPHNLAELCDAMQEIIKKPDVGIDRLMEIIQGPDFPTGGVIVQPHEDIINAYKTGRGGIRLRAKWHREDLERGQYQIVVTEIPYMVQKSDLIAKIAALMEERKLPLLSDIRDESAEDIRIVVEPKTRTVDQQMLMEHLFKNSELEVTFGINMNVLDKDSVPSVMDIGQVLRAFLNHRMDVLMRRGKYRHGKVVSRLEVLAGLLIAYLNLDAIIRIIRNEDEPKPVMMSKFRLSDIQAEAILNMRLRALRKLDEQALNDEHAALQKEKAGLEEMFGSEKIRWSLISKQIKHVKDTLGGGAAGKRRTIFAEAPKGISINLESMIEKEPITVILSQKGWLRAVRGHGVDTSSLMFKEGDALFSSIACQTTDKLIMFDSTGKFYTIAADRISRGRGFGEPIRLMADISDNADIVAIKTYTADGILLIATDAGKGFLVKESDVLAQTKNGRQVLNCGQSKSIFCMPVADNDMAAVIGSHRKLLVFKLSEIPLMQRGAGVWLQKPVDNCKLCDVKLFRQPDGLSYTVKGAGVVEQNLAPWIGRRASAGRVAMPLLARNNRFD